MWCPSCPLVTPHLTTSAERGTSKHKHNIMSKRHTDSTSDENPRKRRKLSAGEVLVEAARKGDTTAVRAGLEKFTPDIASKTVAFDAVHEACRGNHDECLALLLPYVETTQMGFGILLSECVHADHTACTEVLLQHWKSVCSNVAHVPLESEDSKGQTSGLCPAMWSDPAVCQVFIDAGADIEAKDVEGHSPLHFACSSGSLDVVKLLVRAGAGVRVTCLIFEACNIDISGCTALHLAARYNHADVVQVLIDAGADIEARDNSGNSPLHFACRSGSLDVVKLLVRAGAGVRVTDNGGYTCLTIAALTGHTETVRYAVGLKEVEVDHATHNGGTALHWAAHNNHADVVQVLIDAGADIEARDNTGYSPLHFACRSGSLDTVKLLVRAGAGVRAGDEGFTCLIHASRNGHTETVRYLVVVEGAQLDHVSDDYNHTALHGAADNYQADVVQVLIDAGADIEARDNTGCSPLLTSSNREFDCDVIVKKLVEAGARVRAMNTKGQTCLHLAAYFGNISHVRYFVGLPEVDVNHVDTNGRTALHEAAQRGCADVVQVLIDAGADIEVRDNDGCSPLLAASSTGELVSLKKLVEAGAGVRAVDTEARTCLHLAASSRHTETVRYLVGLPEMDVNHVDTNGRIALHEAAQRGCADMVQVLVEHGADTSLRTRNGNRALQLAEISGCRDCYRHLC